MSTRTRFIGLTAIEPLLAVVGSGNEALASRLTKANQKEVEEAWGDVDDLDEDDQEEMQEEIDEFSTYVTEMFLGETESGLEPGAWCYLFKVLIDELKLELPGNLPINKGYKHFYAWGPYADMVATGLTRGSTASLRHIENGRPVKGPGLEADGCLFAWLTPAEITELYQSLAKLDQAAITNCDLQEFHDDLVNSLKVLSEKQAALFVIAH